MDMVVVAASKFSEMSHLSRAEFWLNLTMGKILGILKVDSYLTNMWCKVTSCKFYEPDLTLFSLAPISRPSVDELL